MLRLRYPELHPFIAELPGGMWPLALPDKDDLILIAKVSKEYILTAVERRFIKFYFFKLVLEDKSFIAVFTAFFDDADEPLCVRTLLFNDELSSVLLNVFLQPKLDVYFFDETNRELASFRAEITDPAGLRDHLPNLSRSKSDRSFLADAYKLAVLRFGVRNTQDDDQAFHVNLVSDIFPSDVFTIDLDSALGGYAGSSPVAFHQLVQDSPGTFQEPSILNLLQRLFQNDQLFMNPMRSDKAGKEFADAVVVSDTHVVIVQAKDSPNTKDMIDRSISRKRSTGHKQITAGTGQLKGAIHYAEKGDIISFLIGEQLHEIPIKGKKMVGVVIVRELFPNETALHIKTVTDAREENGCDVVLMDYQGFANLIHHCAIGGTFLRLLHTLSDEVLDNRYPDITQFILGCYVAGYLKSEVS
jgi:hypothetical protein